MDKINQWFLYEIADELEDYVSIFGLIYWYKKNILSSLENIGTDSLWLRISKTAYHWET